MEGWISLHEPALERFTMNRRISHNYQSPFPFNDKSLLYTISDFAVILFTPFMSLIV